VNQSPLNLSPISNLTISVSATSTNPALVYLSQLSASSRRTMRGALDTIATLVSAGKLDAINFPWAELRYQHTQAIYVQLSDRYASSTANKMMAALSRVLEEAWKLGLMSAEDYHRAIAIERKTGQRLLKGRALSIGEIQALFHVCAQDKSVKGSRDAALIAVLYGAGLRRSEVVALDLSDWNMVDNCLTVRSGKGDKDRTTYLDEGAAAALTDWLMWRGEEAGALFYPTRRGGNLERRRMTDQAVLDILRQRGKEAQIASFSPHDFRRTFISNLLDRGADISTVQKLAGHASPVTTARYDRRGEAAKRKAANLLVESRAGIIPRPSLLDPSVRLSPHSAPDILRV
jgi:integrase/recombinase XerD